MIKKTYDPIHDRYTLKVDKSELLKAFASTENYVKFLESLGIHVTLQDITGQNENVD